MVRPGPRAVGRDVRPDEERFPVPERDVGVLELGASFPQRLDLRSGQDETRLRAILDEEIVKRLAVRRHSLNCGSACGGQRLLLRHERGSLSSLRACAVSAPSTPPRATRPVAASIAPLTPRRRVAPAASPGEERGEGADAGRECFRDRYTWFARHAVVVIAPRSREAARGARSQQLIENKSDG